MTNTLKRLRDAFFGPVIPKPVEIAAPPGGYTDGQIDAIRIGLAMPPEMVLCDHPDCRMRPFDVVVLPSRTAPAGWTHLALVDRHRPDPGQLPDYCAEVG